MLLLINCIIQDLSSAVDTYSAGSVQSTSHLLSLRIILTLFSLLHLHIL